MAAVVPVLAGAFSAGGIGATLLGGLISGLGAGMMKKAESKEEERRQIAEERRREQRYEGVGQATRLWEQESPTAGAGIDPDYQRVQATDNFDKALGQTAPPKPGSRYRTPSTTARRPTYNRQTRSIQYS